MKRIKASRTVRQYAVCVALLVALLAQASLAKAISPLDTLLEQSKLVKSPSASKAVLDKMEQSLAADLDKLSPRDFVSAADAFGNLVSGARDQGAAKSDFEALLTGGNRFYQRCRDKVRNLEQIAGDDEAALEKLYRSDLWHDINYALSAFNYWQAWTQLGLAHTYQGEREQVKWLNEAEHGFQSASVRILYPGIVYGSWLGMGYVAQTRGDENRAEQHFRRLVLALAGDKDSPVRAIAETELTLLAIRKGELPTLPPISHEPLTPTTAHLYQEQAFMLLQRHRKTQSGAQEAGVRLKRVIEQGYLNDTLLNRILSYRDEIAGQDIGVLSLYVDSEYAYAWQQYDTAVLKYQAFRQQGGFDLPVNVRVLQYHYAVSLLKIRMAREALNEVEGLQHKTDLPQAVAQALPKLKFLIAQTLYQRLDNSVNRQRVLTEADYFLRLSPGDADAGSAHLMIAQLSEDPAKARRHLQAAKQDKNLKGSVALTELQRGIGAFNQAIGTGELRVQRSQAEKVLEALADLPRAKRKEAWFKAVSLQMRAVLEKDLDKVLAEIRAMYAEEKAAPDNEKYRLDSRVRGVLLWTELRALDAYQQGQLLPAFIGKLALDPVNTMVQKEVYQFFLAKEQQQDFAQILELGEAFYPALTGQPQDQRQLRLLQIRAANALGETNRAYGIAQLLIADFSDSGDAWMAYAESAEQMQRWFEAERAWAKISKGQPDGSPRWRYAMFKRIAVLTVQAEDDRAAGAKAGENISSSLCNVVSRLKTYRHLMADLEQIILDKHAASQGCKNENNKF